jgi:hypothetical protein
VSISKVISELNRLVADGLVAKYAIGGAVAAQAYIETSSTEDIDAFVIVAGDEARSLAPLGPIWSDLVGNGAKQDGQYLVIGDWPLQLLINDEQLYVEAIEGARPVDFDGQTAYVMSPEHLAAIALKTGRSKDYQRVAEFISQGSTTVEQVTELVGRFDLHDAWKKYLTRFPPDDANS